MLCVDKIIYVLLLSLVLILTKDILEKAYSYLEGSLFLNIIFLPVIALIINNNQELSILLYFNISFLILTFISLIVRNCSSIKSDIIIELFSIYSISLTVSIILGTYLYTLILFIWNLLKLLL